MVRQDLWLTICPFHFLLYFLLYHLRSNHSCPLHLKTIICVSNFPRLEPNHESPEMATSALEVASSTRKLKVGEEDRPTKHTWRLIMYALKSRLESQDGGGEEL